MSELRQRKQGVGSPAPDLDVKLLNNSYDSKKIHNDEDITDLDGTDWLIAAAFTVLGMLTRFYRIAEPPEIVFDE
ncbi:hypothetical protein SARC_15744, partial [Sphaeroforma arctica JP610]